MEWTTYVLASDGARFRDRAFSKDSSIDDPLVYPSSSSSSLSSSSDDRQFLGVDAPPSSNQASSSQIGGDDHNRGARRRSHRPRGCRGGRKNRKKQLARTAPVEAATLTYYQVEIGATNESANFYYQHHHQNHHHHHHQSHYSGNPLSPKENHIMLESSRDSAFRSGVAAKWGWGTVANSNASFTATNCGDNDGWPGAATISGAGSMLIGSISNHQRAPGHGSAPSDENGSGSSSYWRPPSMLANRANIDTAATAARGQAHRGSAEQGNRGETFGLSVATNNGDGDYLFRPVFEAFSLQPVPGEGTPQEILPPPPPKTRTSPEHDLCLEGPNPYALTGSANKSAPALFTKDTMHRKDLADALAPPARRTTALPGSTTSETESDRHRLERIERQRRMMADGSGSLFATSPRSFLLGGGRSMTNAEVAW